MTRAARAQAMLGQDNRQKPQVVVEAHQRVEHILRRLGIELRSRLSSTRIDLAQASAASRYAPPLATGEGLEVAQRREVERSSVSSTRTHLQAAWCALQRKGNLIPDASVTNCAWVLKDTDPFRMRGVAATGAPLDAHVAAQRSPLKCGTSPFRQRSNVDLPGTRQSR